MENLDSELFEVLCTCLDAPIEELESLKAKVLALFERGAQIDEDDIVGLETYVSDLEQEYWDDRAVYAGRSVKTTEEYRILKVLQYFHKAKDKAKAFDSFFMPVTKSKGVTYQPKTKAELKKLVKNRYIYLGDIDVSSIKNFDKLFEDSYRKDFSGIESWDVSHITSMYAMFEGAKYFNADISKWNVSKVTDMTYMFNGAERFNQNIHWQLNNACLVEGMFDGTPLESNPPEWFIEAMGIRKHNGKYQPKTTEELCQLIEDKVALIDIDTSLITSMNSLFNCSDTTTTKTTDFSGIESWDMSKVTDTSFMFSGVENVNADISKWNVSKVKTMAMMFFGVKNIQADISDWNVSKVKDMRYMFKRAENFNQNLEKWKVRDDCLVDDMFEGTPLENNPPKWYKDRTDSNELADIQSVRIFIREAKHKGGLVKKSHYVDVYKKAFEAVKNIHSHKTINDKELYRIFELCVSDESLCYDIDERTSSHDTRVKFVPLEFVAFLIDNAKDKSVVLGKHQKKKDFVRIAINSRRKDIADLLVKNGY